MPKNETVDQTAGTSTSDQTAEASAVPKDSFEDKELLYVAPPMSNSE